MSGAPTERIDALLPQTQCTRCGYPDCRSYAQALADGAADINQCPPGGQTTLDALAALLQRPVKPIDPARGLMPAQAAVARVDEPDCIGCYKCVAACPVDAIVGAPKLMHTIIAADCSGCELCLPVCPTDCIRMVMRPATAPLPATLAGYWRARYTARKQRLQEHRPRKDKPGAGPVSEASLQDRARRFDLSAAISRARTRRDASLAQKNADETR